MMTLSIKELPFGYKYEITFYEDDIERSGYVLLTHKGVTQLTIPQMFVYVFGDKTHPWKVRLKLDYS